METLLGRRRSIPELQSRNAQLRSAGERMAINMPIQGTAADIMKIALIRLHERLAAERSPARMLLSVHDEVLLEVPRAEVAGLAPIVREVMEGALKLDVPLDVDIKVGTDWESMTPAGACLTAHAGAARGRDDGARPRATLVGATITGVWWDWRPVIRHPSPESFREGLVGRTRAGVSRGAPSGSSSTSMTGPCWPSRSR